MIADAPTVTVRYNAELGVYVAFCVELGVYSQSTTEARAREALDEAIRLYLKHAQPDA